MFGHMAATQGVPLRALTQQVELFRLVMAQMGGGALEASDQGGARRRAADPPRAAPQPLSRRAGVLRVAARGRGLGRRRRSPWRAAGLHRAGLHPERYRPGTSLRRSICPPSEPRPRGVGPREPGRDPGGARLSVYLARRLEGTGTPWRRRVGAAIGSGCMSVATGLARCGGWSSTARTMRSRRSGRPGATAAW